MTLQKREELLLFSDTYSGSMKSVWTLKALRYFSKWKSEGRLLGLSQAAEEGWGGLVWLGGLVNNELQLKLQ